MASELVMSEGPCPVERRTFISTLEMGYAAFARAVIDLNISHVQMCGGVANRLRPWLCHHGAFRRHT